MLDFPSMRMSITEEATILSSTVPLDTLSSAVVGGGFQRVATIINHRVPKTYNNGDPSIDLYRWVEAYGIAGPFVGMLTGVPMHGTRVVTLSQDDLIVTSVITAGVNNAVTAGITPPATFVAGTINMVILIDARLEAAAMVNAVITATEAKAAVLALCGVRGPEGEPATGTSTDAIVIACTGRGETLPYAGPATPVGHLIGKSVQQCLIQALEPCGIFPHIENIQVNK